MLPLHQGGLSGRCDWYRFSRTQNLHTTLSHRESRIRALTILLLTPAPHRGFEPRTPESESGMLPITLTGNKWEIIIALSLPSATWGTPFIGCQTSMVLTLLMLALQVRSCTVCENRTREPCLEDRYVTSTSIRHSSSSLTSCYRGRLVAELRNRTELSQLMRLIEMTNLPPAVALVGFEPTHTGL